MSDSKRDLVSEPVVSRFRGLNRFVNTAELPPDSATDLLNIMCSLSGGLTPLRQPKPITVNDATHTFADVVVDASKMPWDPALLGNAALPFANGSGSVLGAVGPSIAVQAGQTIRLSTIGTIEIGFTLAHQYVQSGAGTLTHTLVEFGLVAGQTYLWNYAYHDMAGGAIADSVNVQFYDAGLVLINPTYPMQLGGPKIEVTIPPGAVHLGFNQTLGGNMDVFIWEESVAVVAGPDGIAYSVANPYPGGGVTGTYPVTYVAGASGVGPVKMLGLMGAFTNAGGVVVQTVAVGALKTLTVPIGATKLILGVNYNTFNENSSGAFSVTADIATPTAGPSVFTGICYGISDFQQANGTRQIVTVWGTKIIVLTAVNGVWQLAQTVDDNVDNAAFWSMTASSNILYMANGKRMLKWTGTVLQKWGIRKPSVAPANPVVNNGAGGVTLLVGRKYRAAYKNSTTGTLSSASNASVSSGPATNATISTSINAVADAAADPQIDTVVWYGTLDVADGVYYYLSEVPINKAGLTLLVDNTADPSTSTPTQLTNAANVSDPAKQSALAGNNWEFLVAGVSQWRTAHGPAVGANLPIMLAKQFPLNVPSNAIITGIKVQFDANAEAATTAYISKVQLYKGGVAIGAPKVFGAGAFTIVSVPGSSTPYPFGSASDDWGAGLLPAGANDQTFGFGVTINFAQDIRLFLFGFSIWVYYSLPTSSTTVINSLVQAQLINDPPPVGKYLKAWGGRVLVAGMADSPQDVAYSGYEKILDGRQEEAFPPNNLIRITSGADWIRGMGTVQAGVLIGTKSNELYMLRGELEDVVTGVPLSFTEQLETLPFSTGFASHYAIMDTPIGSVYLSAQRTIDNYAGINVPDTMSSPITGILRDIPAGLEESCIGVFYNYLEKDWAVLAIPYGVGAVKPNLIIIVDLDLNRQNNTGIFLFDIGAFDTIAVVEDPASGRPTILIAQNGKLIELQAITPGNNTLLPADAADAIPVAQPFWSSGWWGGETPQTSKMFRHAYLVADGGIKADPIAIPPVVANDFALEASLVNDRTKTFRSPEVIPMATLDSGKGTINRKSKRCKVKIKFPTGINASVQQLWVSYIPTGER